MSNAAAQTQMVYGLDGVMYAVFCRELSLFVRCTHRPRLGCRVRQTSARSFLLGDVECKHHPYMLLRSRLYLRQLRRNPLSSLCTLVTSSV
jgi:hypothetical protein